MASYLKKSRGLSRIETYNIGTPSYLPIVLLRYPKQSSVPGIGEPNHLALGPLALAQKQSSLWGLLPCLFFGGKVK